MVAHTLNPSNWETEAVGSLSLRTAWSTEFQDSQDYQETLLKNQIKKKGRGEILYFKAFFLTKNDKLQNYKEKYTVYQFGKVLIRKVKQLEKRHILPEMPKEGSKRDLTYQDPREPGRVA